MPLVVRKMGFVYKRYVFVNLNARRYGITCILQCGIHLSKQLIAHRKILISVENCFSSNMFVLFCLKTLKERCLL